MLKINTNIDQLLLAVYLSFAPSNVQVKITVQRVPGKRDLSTEFSVKEPNMFLGRRTQRRSQNTF